MEEGGLYEAGKCKRCSDILYLCKTELKRIENIVILTKTLTLIPKSLFNYRNLIEYRAINYYYSERSKAVFVRSCFDSKALAVLILNKTQYMSEAIHRRMVRKIQILSYLLYLP